jgi:hypothetical protein
MVKSQCPKVGNWKVNEGRNKKPTLKPMFNYLLNKYTNADPKDQVMKRPRSPIRQERREQLKQGIPKAKGKGIAEEGYDLRFFKPSQIAHPFGHPSASSSMGFLGSQMQWCPSPMMPTYLVWDLYRQIWVNCPPMIPWDWGGTSPIGF